MSISLCIIIKDEAQFLEKFLSHHKPLADEIIVIDTGSTDNSIEIAKRFTDKVFNFIWDDDFSKARNFSIKKAECDWILWLDPDERIDEKDFKKIIELTKNKDYLGCSFIQKTYTNVEAHPRFIREEKNNKKNIYKGYYVRRICKLFQNKKELKFEYPIHETVINSIKKLKGKINHTDIIIEHFPEEKGKDFLIKKKKTYLQLLEKKKKDFPDSNAEKEMSTEKMILDSLD